MLQMKCICKWWLVSVTTSVFGGKPVVELGVDNTKMTIFVNLNLFLAPKPIIKDEDGLILQILEEFRVNAENLHKLVEWSLPKAHLREKNLQWDQKQRGQTQSDYYLHISEFGGNLKVNKSNFVEIADLRLFGVLYKILFLAKPDAKVIHNFPSCTGVFCVKRLLSEVCCRN